MARATKRSPVTVLPTPAPAGADGPASLAALLARLDQRLQTTPTAFQALPTGFEPLDETLGGGLRPGDLVLIAGGQGTGKTTLALQIARNLASTNTARGLFVSFEHDENELVLRLLAMEGWLADQEAALSLRDLQQLLAAAGRRGQPLPTLAKDRPALAVALERLAACHERLFLTKGGSQTTTVAAIADLLERVLAATAGPVVLFIDYLQKVPAEGAFASEAERIGRVAEALKDLALSRAVPVVAVAALDSEGLRAPRRRHDQRRQGERLRPHDHEPPTLDGLHRHDAVTRHPHPRRFERRATGKDPTAGGVGAQLLGTNAHESAGHRPTGRVLHDAAESVGCDPRPERQRNHQRHHHPATLAIGRSGRSQTAVRHDRCSTR